MDEQQLQITERQQPFISTNALTDYEKQSLAAMRKMRSVCKNREDCLFGNHPTLQEMNNNSKGSAVVLICNLLDLMNGYTNKGKLDRLQSINLSETICDKFFYLKETEVMLFFNDFFKYVSSDDFYGAIEPNTITTKLTKWVRMIRSAAIKRHDDILDMQRKEEEKPYHITWEEFCSQNGNNSSDSPIGRILSGFGKSKAPRDTQESITESAQALINNKWGYDDDTMTNARRSFACRYGYSPEDYLRKEGKYV